MVSERCGTNQAWPLGRTASRPTTCSGFTPRPIGGIIGHARALTRPTETSPDEMVSGRLLRSVYGGADAIRYAWRQPVAHRPTGRFCRVVDLRVHGRIVAWSQLSHCGLA